MNKHTLWTGICAFAGILILILDSKTALTGAQEGLQLCIRTVIPSLFPFFVLSNLLTGALMGMDFPMLRPFGKLFGMPKGTEFLLIPAFLGGYPAGAQGISAAYQAGQIRKANAERLLAFCNNAGPSFLFGMVGQMFPDALYSWALWGIHMISALLVSSIFYAEDPSCELSIRFPGGITESLATALKTTSLVCGWVILFRVLIAFLNRWCYFMLPTAAQVAVAGLLELTNGCCSLLSVEHIPSRFVLCSGLLAAGGLCVTMQTLSTVKGLSLRYYFRGKGLQTLFSVVISLSIWHSWLLIPLLLLYFLAILEKFRKNSRNPAQVGV